MKSVVLFVAAIVCCAMAMDSNDFFKYMCSVSATGTISTQLAPLPLPCKMIRVKDVVRYDVMLSSGEIVGSLVMRPDWYGSYFYFSIPSPVCDFISKHWELKYYDNEGINEDGLHVFTRSSWEGNAEILESALYFNDKGVLVKEFLNISSFLGPTTFTYNNVDTTYEHNDIDSAFSIDHDECDSEAATLAPNTISERLCADVSWPDYMCSVSANGTAFLRLNTGDELEADVQMVRVQSSAHYDFIDKKNGNVVFSYVIRPDVYSSYLYKPGVPSMCLESQSFSFAPRDDFEEITEDGYEQFGRYYPSFYFDHQNRDLKKERLYVSASTSASSSISLDIDINYTSVNRDYVSGSNDFVIQDGSCPAEVRTSSPYGDSSIICGAEKEVKSVIQDCGEEIFAHVLDSSYGPENMTIKVLMKDGNVWAVKMVYEQITEVVRCDVKSKLGGCLSILRGKIYGEDMCFDDSDPDDFSLYEMLSLFSFKYRGEPMDSSCPDNSTGCKKYCSYDEDGNECHIFDPEGHLIAIDEMVFFEYKNIVPSVGEFADKYCDGKALKAPADPCGVPASSSSSVKPSKTSGSSIGSASFALPSVLLVVVVMVLALF